ncbi:MAG TPA: D-glycerate dehydrogenase [Solirubrobacteraceae bacterium]|nr:D-glycerate dehydrogenase [Solirubrobacteraceae bacterium]
MLASLVFPGPAFEELDDVELLTGPLTDVIRSKRTDVEALAVVHEVVDDRTLDRLPALRIVANFGVGYDGIDVAACAARGVPVTNTPGVLDAATADLTFSLVLATRRRLVEGDELVRRGTWPSGVDRFLGADVSGATMGLVGLGRIGRAVARRARAFDMRILYTKRTRLSDDEEQKLGVEYRELDGLLSEADVVSVHVPLEGGTEGLIDARRLALLREGACLVNTSRGPVIDEPALVEALAAGSISAGLDVFADEPHVPERLLGLPNVVLAPHIGSATVRTREAMTRVLVDNLLAAADGRSPPTRVSAT